MLNMQMIKAAALAVVTLGISFFITRYGANKKDEGVKQEQLKQRTLDVIAKDKLIKRIEENAAIEIDNSQLTTEQLINSVWTKPDIADS